MNGAAAGSAEMTYTVFDGAGNWTLPDGVSYGQKAGNGCRTG